MLKQKFQLKSFSFVGTKTNPSYEDICHPFLWNQVIPELGVQAFWSSLDTL